ncbi:NmrA family protein [Tricladium varicosporioides]|nr:NmrA family protein [Hymenoscyphus varicosporioides]
MCEIQTQNIGHISESLSCSYRIFLSSHDTFDMETYLVTQATGQQSQWVITHLIAAGVKVHAVVRNCHKVPLILEHSSVTLFEGESTNFDIILQAAQGCKAVFLNTFPMPGLEAQQSKTVIEACKKAGVESIVASTTFNADNKAFWDDSTTKECGMHWYFAAKGEVEHAVRNAGFKAYTILRPVWMIHDYLLPSAPYNFLELATKGVLDHAYNTGTKMVHTDSFDVGKYAAAALQDPAKFGGQEINLGNEALTIEEVRDILVKVSGREVQVRKRTPEEMEAVKDVLFSQGIQLLASAKDISAASASAKGVQAKFGITFTSFEMAMQRDKARLLKCLPAA